jgi:hypothetical protein
MDSGEPHKVGRYPGEMRHGRKRGGNMEVGNAKEVSDVRRNGSDVQSNGSDIQRTGWNTEKWVKNADEELETRRTRSKMRMKSQKHRG